MKSVDQSSVNISSIDPYIAKIHKLRLIGIVVGLISLIAGLTAVVITITATDLKYFPAFVTSVAICFIGYIGIWILQKKIDLEEAKSRQDLYQKWAKLHSGD